MNVEFLLNGTDVVVVVGSSSSVRGLYLEESKGRSYRIVQGEGQQTSAGGFTSSHHQLWEYYVNSCRPISIP